MALVSGAEIGRMFGISRACVCKAAKNGRLFVAGRDQNGRPLYDADHARKYFVADVFQSQIQVSRKGKAGCAGKACEPLVGEPLRISAEVRDKIETRMNDLRPAVAEFNRLELELLMADLNF